MVIVVGSIVDANIVNGDDEKDDVGVANFENGGVDGVVIVVLAVVFFFDKILNILLSKGVVLLFDGFVDNLSKRSNFIDKIINKENIKPNPPTAVNTRALF